MHDINKINSSLMVLYDISEVKKLKNVQKEYFKEQRELVELEFLVLKAPPNVVFDKTAIINKTMAIIPDDIIMSLSFGPKFIHPFEINETNAAKYVALISESIGRLPNEIVLEAEKLARIEIMRHKSTHHNSNIHWLNMLYHRQTKFFDEHQEIILINSDKGKHVVIFNRGEYCDKILDLVPTDDYQIIHGDPTPSLNTQNAAFIRSLMKNKNLEHMQLNTNIGKR